MPRRKSGRWTREKTDADLFLDGYAKTVDIKRPWNDVACWREEAERLEKLRGRPDFEELMRTN